VCVSVVGGKCVCECGWREVRVSVVNGMHFLIANPLSLIQNGILSVHQSDQQ